MKFMVELRLKPGNRNRAFDAFERGGPNLNPGVTFRGAWLGTRSDMVFSLVESADESLVAQAAQLWSEYGDCQITPVLDIEQI
jgi:hypothetical protein